jgi:hemimethylated DNA binding protein
MASEAAGKQRISLALYRQLLRWCIETDDDIPLSFFVPPVYMTEPHIDVVRLSTLSDEDKSIFPANSILERNQITCPIHNSEDARRLFRAVFRLNRAPTDDAQVQKQRVTLAFEGIRSLNTLSQGLQALKQNRAKHVLRDGVSFRVGQVVKHKIENWRGVVIGWRRVEPNTSAGNDKATSLTKKAYDLDPNDHVKCTILVDSGDAHLHYSKRTETSNLSRAEVHQTEIELVDEKRWVR